MRKNPSDNRMLVIWFRVSNARECFDMFDIDKAGS